MIKRTAFSLLELLLALTIGVVVIASTIAFVLHPRDRIALQSCKMRQAELQIRVEEYNRIAGRYPSASMRELGTTSSPVPICPINGQPYLFDPTTKTIRPHTHP